MAKLSQAKLAANKRWEKKNTETRRRINDKSAAKRFVRESAELADMAFLLAQYAEAKGIRVADLLDALKGLEG